MFPLGAFILIIGYALFYTGLTNVNVVFTNLAPVRLQDALGFSGNFHIAAPWAGVATA